MVIVLYDNGEGEEEAMALFSFLLYEQLMERLHLTICDDRSHLQPQK